MSEFEKRIAAMKKAIPASGFNLVRVDDYEDDPEHEVKVLAHFDTEAEANAALAEHNKKRPDDQLYIYAADDGSDNDEEESD